MQLCLNCKSSISVESIMCQILIFISEKDKMLNVSLVYVIFIKEGQETLNLKYQYKYTVKCCTMANVCKHFNNAYCKCLTNAWIKLPYS